MLNYKELIEQLLNVTREIDQLGLDLYAVIDPDGLDNKKDYSLSAKEIGERLLELHGTEDIITIEIITKLLGILHKMILFHMPDKKIDEGDISDLICDTTDAEWKKEVKKLLKE